MEKRHENMSRRIHKNWKKTTRTLTVGLQVIVGTRCIGILFIKGGPSVSSAQGNDKECIETAVLHYLENSNSTHHGCHFHTSRLFHSVGAFISKKDNSTWCAVAKETESISIILSEFIVQSVKLLLLVWRCRSAPCACVTFQTVYWELLSLYAHEGEAFGFESFWEAQ